MDKHIVYKGINCSICHIHEGVYGFCGKETWQLWAKIEDNNTDTMEFYGFQYFDRGLYMPEIDAKTSNELLE